MTASAGDKAPQQEESGKVQIFIFIHMEIVKLDNIYHTGSLEKRTINYIVIHYTAFETSNPGKALETAEFFRTTDWEASPDFIVDDKYIAPALWAGMLIQTMNGNGMTSKHCSRCNCKMKIYECPDNCDTRGVC